MSIRTCVLRGCALAFGLVVGSAASAQAGGSLMSQCSATLKPNYAAVKSNKVAEYAMLKTMQQASSSGHNTEASGEYLKYISGKYGSSDNAENSFSSKDQLNWSTSEYLDYVAAYVPTQGYAAYTDCVNAVLDAPGIHIKIDSADSDAIAISMHFKGAFGTTQPYHLQIKTTNTDQPLIDLPSVAASGTEQAYILQKQVKTSRVIIIANIVSGPSSGSAEVLRIPPPWTTVTTATVENFEIAEPGEGVACSGNGSGDPKEGPEYGPGPLLQNQEFVPSATQVQATKRGSWNDNGYLSNPPYYRLAKNDTQAIRAVTICMPNNIDVRTWLSTKILYQVATKTEKLVLMP